MAKVHGESHPEVAKVTEIFDRIVQDLTLHMLKEEKIVFPFVKEPVSVKKTGLYFRGEIFWKCDQSHPGDGYGT